MLIRFPIRFCKALELAASALETDATSARLLQYVKDEGSSTTTSDNGDADQSKRRATDSKDYSPHPNKCSKEPWLDLYVRGKVRNLRKPFNSLVIGSKARKHTPLFERPLCESLEDRVQHFVKRRRIVMVEKGVERKKNDSAKTEDDAETKDADD